MTTAESLATLKDFIPTGLAARELGVTTTCIRSLCERGHLPGACQPWGADFGWIIPAASVAARKLAKKRGLLPPSGRPKSQVVDGKRLKKIA